MHDVCINVHAWNDIYVAAGERAARRRRSEGVYFKVHIVRVCTNRRLESSRVCVCVLVCSRQVLRGKCGAH